MPVAEEGGGTESCDLLVLGVGEAIDWFVILGGEN